MSRQLDLVAPLGLDIHVQEGRKEPRLWVRRLVVWSRPGEILREIPLRCGLNVIWSPDPAEHEREQEGPAGLSHGAGKTLFCRLLRYCLGENTFAPDEERGRIVLAFPEGQVGAEVIVDGCCWAIVRPIGTGRKHYAIPDAGLDAIAGGTTNATGIDSFLAAIETSILSTEVAALVPGDRPPHAWLVALAWLTRDQECRFDHVLDWRAEESNSGSPARALSVANTLDALRALIGAIVREEHTLRDEIGRLEKEHQQIRDESNRHDWAANRMRSRLIAALSLREEDLSGGRMDIEPLRKAATVALTELETTGSVSDTAGIDTLRNEYDAGRERVVALEKALAIVQTRIPEIERQVSMIAGELPGLSASALLAGSPVCPICEVPIDRALADGCKLSHKLPNPDQIRARWERAKQQHADESERLRVDKEQQQRIAGELVPARERAVRLREQLRAAERLRDSRSDAWHRARSLLDTVEQLDELLVAQEQGQSTADGLASSIKADRERLGAFRDVQADVFRRLSRLFDAIVRELVGGNAKGTVLLDGKGLRLFIEMAGERSTAAIDSLKILAFDLAVLCMSIEGETHLPAFLVHDSPREADLGLSVYHQLFRLALSLEHLGPEPLFQYIVTTTTRPPSDFLKKPWLVETLYGLPADARLLRRDL